MINKMYFKYFEIRYHQYCESISAHFIKVGIERILQTINLYLYKNCKHTSICIKKTLSSRNKIKAIEDQNIFEDLQVLEKNYFFKKNLDLLQNHFYTVNTSKMFF